MTGFTTTDWVVFGVLTIVLVYNCYLIYKSENLRKKQP